MHGVRCRYYFPLKLAPKYEINRVGNGTKVLIKEENSLHQQNMKENRDIMEMKNGVNNLP